MNMSHGIFDYALFALLLAVPAIERWVTWPRYLERLKTGDPGVRAGFYRTLILEEWIAAMCLLGWWAWKARPWGGLMLTGSPTPWRMGVGPGVRLCAGLGYVALLIGLMAMQKKLLLKKPERVEKARRALAYAEPLLPHTELERRLFWGVSATAGVCEGAFLSRVPGVVSDGVDGADVGGDRELGDLRSGTHLYGLGAGAEDGHCGTHAGVCGAGVGVAVAGDPVARGDGLEFRGAGVQGAGRYSF